jgi:hypothetical protein
MLEIISCYVCGHFGRGQSCIGDSRLFKQEPRGRVKVRRVVIGTFKDALGSWAVREVSHIFKKGATVAICDQC